MMTFVTAEMGAMNQGQRPAISISTAQGRESLCHHRVLMMGSVIVVMVRMNGRILFQHWILLILKTLLQSTLHATISVGSNVNYDYGDKSTS